MAKFYSNFGARSFFSNKPQQNFVNGAWFGKLYINGNIEPIYFENVAKIEQNVPINQIKSINLQRVICWKLCTTSNSSWTMQTVWPDWAIYWTLGNFLKPLATINLPQSPPFLGNFWKLSKSIIFLVKLFLGNIYRHLAIFFWSHCMQTFNMI